MGPSVRHYDIYTRVSNGRAQHNSPKYRNGDDLPVHKDEACGIAKELTTFLVDELFF